MKVANLFELNYSPKRPDGTRIGYVNGPHYKSEKQASYKDGKSREFTRTGIVVGMVGDWLDEMGATREDLAPAMEKARQSEEYQKLLKIGFDEMPNKRATGNGTFIFKGRKGAMLDDEGKPSDTVYRRVLANGRITSVSTWSDGSQSGYTGRLKSAEPATMKTHPDLSPVERLVLNYTRAFAGIYKVQAPKFQAALRARLKAGKEAR